MRSLFALIITSLSLGAATTFAQPVYSPEKRAKLEVQWLQDSLGITPQQATKAGSISLTYNRQMDKAADMKEAAAKKSRQKVIRQKKNIAMKALLTDEQYQHYALRALQQQLLEDQRAQNRNKGRKPL